MLSVMLIPPPCSQLTSNCQPVLHFCFVTWRMFYRGIIQYVTFRYRVSSQAPFCGVSSSRSFLVTAVRLIQPCVWVFV